MATWDSVESRSTLKDRRLPKARRKGRECTTYTESAREERCKEALPEEVAGQIQ